VREINVEPFESETEPRPAGSDTMISASSKFVVAQLRNSRKTVLDRLAVRAAPFALPAGRGSVFHTFLRAFHIYVAHPSREAPLCFGGTFE
jgi:hypothetical protein